MTSKSIIALMLIIQGFTYVSAQQPAPETERPNIIFILADDLGYYDIGCYGNPFNHTPNIDSLAKRGMLFTQFYASSPVCSPSRAAILTGKHPARLHLTNFLGGVRQDPTSNVLPADYQQYLSPSESTIAELLKAEGYQTGIVGKWHLGTGDSVSAVSQGFDYDRIINKNALDYYNYSISSNGEDIFNDDGSAYLTDRLTDYAIEFIEQQSDAPFFLYLPYSAPHVFVVPKADKLRKYLLKYNQFGGKYNPYYATMVESLDDGVGRILHTLRQKGLDKNTIVIFTSDNGGVGVDELGPVPTSMEPLKFWKGFVYEGGIRVPLIICWPEVIKGDAINQHHVMNTDFLPTFLDILRVNRPIGQDIDGKSFLSTLVDPQQTFERGALYWHYPHFSNQGGRPAGAVRLGDYKLIESYETGKLELYNLRVDSAEHTDLSLSNPSLVRELHARFKWWRTRVNANMPLPRRRGTVQPFQATDLPAVSH